jgi:hypothetical protein
VQMKKGFALGQVLSNADYTPKPAFAAFARL